MKDGKVVVNKSFGKANREKDIDVTKNTRYDPIFFFEDTFLFLEGSIFPLIKFL